MPTRIGVDIGGTFTDIVAVDPESGALRHLKVPTEVDPARSFQAGLRRLLNAEGAPGNGDVSAVLHGTTVATNIILERSGARTALVTTEGFLHVLEIGRHDVPRGVSPYIWEKPSRPVEPAAIIEVSERMAHDGTCLRPLTEAEIERLVGRLAELDPEAVAVCLLHAYINDEHERCIRDAIQNRLPGVPISLSSEVLPVFREFERSMATVLNAYVTPAVQRYVERIDGFVQEVSPQSRLLIMKSNGGLLNAGDITDMAFQTALSGPAAGAVGAALVASLAGYPDAISMDVGGTSTDICLIRDGRYEITKEGAVGEFPCHIPMVDIETIGAGGGSIAYFSRTGNLLVGPRSAGANPGPACYLRGGTEPTVTDANLALGRLPEALLDGEFPLNAAASVLAVEKIAGPLDMPVEEAADGVLWILVHNMAQAIRSISIERGLDPRGFALVAFGGAGPLHACRVANLLQIETVIVPSIPGVLSALGLLAADIKNDYAQTCLVRGPAYDVDALSAAVNSLEERATRWLRANGIVPRDARFERFVDARYPGQQHEVTVPLDAEGLTEGNIDAGGMDDVKAAFHAEHARLYGHAHRDAEIEIVTVRVMCSASLPTPDLLAARPTSDAAGRTVPEPVTTRPVYYGREVGQRDTPVFRRGDLVAGHSVAGPAIVEQFDSTVVVEPHFTAEVDAYGNLIMRRA